MFEYGFKHAVQGRLPFVHAYRANKVRAAMLPEAQSDLAISDVIISGLPSLIGRIGGTEARVLSCALELSGRRRTLDGWLYSKLSMDKRKNQLQTGAGVYPIDSETLESFVDEHLRALEQVSIMGVWGTAFTWPELIALENGAKAVPLVATVARFWSMSENQASWIHALTGKRVLVINGFVESMKNQVPYLEQIYNESFPKCEFIFLKSPMSQGGLNDGQTWVDHLAKLKGEMSLIDFDIALISAGGYALPLAAHAKKMGKIGINCGGELQLLFGILGKRWEKYHIIQKYINSYWIRPAENERPPNFLEIEGGCYW